MRHERQVSLWDTICEPDAIVGATKFEAITMHPSRIDP